jgi:hypothetical protein
LATIVTGLRLQVTPAMTAAASAPSRRVLTTNHDDAIERAAREPGIEAIPGMCAHASVFGGAVFICRSPRLAASPRTVRAACVARNPRPVLAPRPSHQRPLGAGAPMQKGSEPFVH